VPSAEELRERMASIYLRLKNAAEKCVERNRLQLKVYAEKKILLDPLFMINEKSIYLDKVTAAFETVVKSLLNEKKQKLGLAVSKLDGLSPLTTLKRGFSVAKNENGSVIKKVTDAKKGSDISIIVSDGEIAAVVK